MTVLSGQSIKLIGMLEPCHPRTAEDGYTYGLGPAGYDLRLDLGNQYRQGTDPSAWTSDDTRVLRPGEFLLAAAQEHFKMPNWLLGVVHDKSSLARRGVSVFNTVIEPGWRGYLTLEIVNHSREAVTLKQGMGIAQVIFHRCDESVERPYDGKYQDQEAGPVPARL